MPVEWCKEHDHYAVTYYIMKSRSKPDQYGLQYIPTLGRGKIDNIEVTGERNEFCSKSRSINDGTSPIHISANDMALVRGEVARLSAKDKQGDEGPKCIVEIGVSGLPMENVAKPTNTETLLSSKPDDAIYIGIDKAGRPLVDKYIKAKDIKNAYTRRADSRDQEAVRNYVTKFAKTIDILLIDGDHSINGMLNDWRYVDLLSRDGIVLIHDTNVYPGPWAIIDAIDPKEFTVQEFFVGDHEYGFAMVWRRTSRRRKLRKFGLHSSAPHRREVIEQPKVEALERRHERTVLKERQGRKKSSNSVRCESPALPKTTVYDTLPKDKAIELRKLAKLVGLKVAMNLMKID